MYMRRKDLIDSAESINIDYIYFIKEKKKCKLYELKNIIKPDILYEMEITITHEKYTYDVCI